MDAVILKLKSNKRETIILLTCVVSNVSRWPDCIMKNSKDGTDLPYAARMINL